MVSAGTANRPPSITSAPPNVASANAAYAYQVTALDPEGEALTFVLLAAPPGMTINATTGLVSWTPTTAQFGNHTVTVSAADPAGSAALQTYVLTVRAANRPPTISSTPPASVTAGASYRHDVRASDPDGDPTHRQARPLREAAVGQSAGVAQ